MSYYIVQIDMEIEEEELMPADQNIKQEIEDTVRGVLYDLNAFGILDVEVLAVDE